MINMRISLPYVQVSDNRVRFVNYSVQNASFIVPNYIEVTDIVDSCII